MEHYSYLTDCVARHSEKKCFVKEDLTYWQVLNLVKSRAAFLQSAGVLKNDIIGLFSANSGDWLITYFAILAVGAQVLLLNTELTTGHLKLIKELNIKAYFSDGRDIFKNPAIKHYEIKTTTNILTAAEFTEVEINDQETAVFSFVPARENSSIKIVPLTHFNVVQTAINTAQRLGSFYAEKVTYTMLPLAHVYGLISAGIAPLFVGSSLVFQTSLKTKEIVADLKKYQVNVFPAVPKVWEFFLDQLAKQYQDLGKKQKLNFFIKYCSFLRKIGLSRVVDKVFAPVRELFGGAITLMISNGTVLKKEYEKAYRSMGFPLIAGYGLTETGGFFSINDPQRFVKYSVGKPLLENKVEIRNARRGKVGEIWLKGSSVFTGYYNKENIAANPFDQEGWFNSGDFGFLDRRGALHISEDKLVKTKTVNK